MKIVFVLTVVCVLSFAVFFMVSRSPVTRNLDFSRSLKQGGSKIDTVGILPGFSSPFSNLKLKLKIIVWDVATPHFRVKLFETDFN